MQCLVMLRKPPLSKPFQLLRQQLNLKPVCPNPIGRSLSTSRALWRLSPTPSLCARKTSDHQEYMKKCKKKTKKPSESVLFYCVFLSITGILIYLTTPKSSRKDSGSIPQKFIPFTIVSKEAISSTSAIFTLRPTAPFPHQWNRGAWSVEFKQPELQIAREYTPLPPLDLEGEEREDLKFLIRKEYRGEVSNYLFGLPVGATVEVRGPKIEWEAPNPQNVGSTSEVIFLAGGTGIAPALQIAHTLLNTGQPPSKLPKIHIIWANRRREDCQGGISTADEAYDADDAPKSWKGWFQNWWWAGVSNSSSPSANAGSININVQYPQPQTEALKSEHQGKSSESNKPLTVILQMNTPEPKYEPNPVITTLSQLHSKFPSNISVEYKVDEENKFIQRKDIQSLVDESSQRGVLKRVIMVCGPEGFVDAISGPRKILQHGREVENKSVGGILGYKELRKKIEEGGWQVVRL